MLMPGQTYDSAGRVKFTSSASPGAPAVINSGFGCTAAGRILGNTSAPAASAARNNGFAFDANGCVHVTTSTAATDVYSGGFRRSADGALVIAQEGTITWYAGAQGFNTDGALVVTEL